MIAEFGHWWAGQLRSLVPQSARGPRQPDGLLVRAVGGDWFEMTPRRNGRLDTPRRVALAGASSEGPRAPTISRPGNLVLLLPPGILLEQRAGFPAVAEAELGSILPLEIDRLTPFPADSIYWSWDVVGRDRANSRVDVRLLMVPKAAVAATLATLAGSGLAPRSLEGAGPDGTMHAVGLLPPGTARRRSNQLRLAAWGCAALAAVACLLPFVQQSLALGMLDSQIEALKPRVALAEGLRRRLADTSGGTDMVAAERARAGDALRTLAAVTAALPDDTVLTDFALRDRTLTLTGRSASAVRLVGLLAQAPGLANPSFAAPVVRTLTERGDQFTIRAEIVP